MKALSLIFVLSLTGFCNVVKAEVKQVISFTELQEIFMQARRDTLGLFDIDMVLIQSKEPAFQMPNMKKYKVLLKELLEPLNNLEKDLTLNLIMKNNPIMLVEKQ